ncbi:helix-turn-helix transcriptional regulator [Streptosporangium sp. NPDC023615]|uniref:helix-turn-helix domain-containing protein n=1 Tax=Streptosporangium sp. NPDC023615 TaxID=3154794 RepID=UPI00342C72C2
MALPKVGSIGEYIREQRTHAKISLRQLATAAGVSNPYLSQIERGLRKPSAEILNQIAKGLHISSQALYVQAGLIEEREPEESDVLAAIRADHLITERQRQVLVDIYESFRKENLAAAAEEEARLAAETATSPAPEGDPASSPDDETPLPGEYLTALKPYAVPPGDGHITKEIKEG